MLSVACTSDIHGKWEGLDYPKADVLIMAGDILRNYHNNRFWDSRGQLIELEKLNDFYGKLKKSGVYREIILVAGNHDFAFQECATEARSYITNAHYLQDSGVDLLDDGKTVKFYGSPWQPWFWDWAFNFPNHQENAFRAQSHAKRTWAVIPNDVNVLITHSPPWGVMDETVRGEKVGCHFLESRLEELKLLRLHVFGHIHHGYGTKVMNGRTYVNAAVCSEHSKPVNPIQVVQV